ncbi:MAG: protoglobin domain-containing protein [Pirellulales bacterium]
MLQVEPDMDPGQLYKRYQDLQRYVGWTADDARRIRDVGERLSSHFKELVADFYAEIERHAETQRVVVGGVDQIARLKETLVDWLRQLFAGQYDEAYVLRRWKVGLRHVEIGLDQQYTNVALSRMRSGMIRLIASNSGIPPAELVDTIDSLNRVLDLDLAIIEDAYQYEYLLRQKRSERLVAIGQMASGIAHELRNPLNVVRTSVFYLQHARRPTPEKQAEHLERIQRQVGIADGVISALSDFAKLPLPVVGPVAWGDLVRETLANHPLPENISVQLSGLDVSPPVRGDARQLSIVVSNLVRNAVDAMPDGGRLAISTEVVGAQVKLIIADTGPGISPEEIHRIFEPFYSTKVRGIGLGLAICRAIVENHAGELRVTSQPGQGSHFSVLLKSAAS